MPLLLLLTCRSRWLLYRLAILTWARKPPRKNWLLLLTICNRRLRINCLSWLLWHTFTGWYNNFGWLLSDLNYEVIFRVLVPLLCAEFWLNLNVLYCCDSRYVLWKYYLGKQFLRLICLLLGGRSRSIFQCGMFNHFTHRTCVSWQQG